MRGLNPTPPQWQQFLFFVLLICNAYLNLKYYIITLAKIVSAEGQWKSERQDEQWVLAQRKKRKNKFSTLEGKAQNCSNTNFKDADIRIPLFVNNVDKNRPETGIIDYILEKTQVRVSLQRIKAKIERQYNVYKVQVPYTNLKLFLDGSLWPTVKLFTENNHKNGLQTR